MRTVGAFGIGTIVGAALVWLWRKDIEYYVENKTQGMRAKAAAGVQSVESTTEKVLDLTEEFVHETKEQVSEAFGAARHVIDPGGAARRHDG